MTSLRWSILAVVLALTACAAPVRPPATPGARAPDLVELRTLDPTLRLDIRYATHDNFLHAKLYREARAFLQREVAEDLLAANAELRAEGYEIVVHDAYRPWSVTKLMWDRAEPAWHDGYVADPAKGSRHNRGCTVDITLARVGGATLEMPTPYDSFAPEAHADATDVSPAALANRERLRAVMARHNFTMLSTEWWHFDHAAWPRYPVLDFRFDEIAPARP